MVGTDSSPSNRLDSAKSDLAAEREELVHKDAELKEASAQVRAQLKRVDTALRALDDSRPKARRNTANKESVRQAIRTALAAHPHERGDALKQRVKHHLKSNELPVFGWHLYFDGELKDALKEAQPSNGAGLHPNP